MSVGLFLITILTVGVVVWVYFWPVTKGQSHQGRRSAVSAPLRPGLPLSAQQIQQPSGDYSQIVRVRKVTDYGRGHARRSVNPPTEIVVLPTRPSPVDQAKQLARSNPKAAALLIKRWLRND